MKFITKEDIEAPIDLVFEALSDFEGYERQALRRGATVARTDSLTHPGVGMGWDVTFLFRDRKRNMNITVVTFERPNEMAISMKSSGIDGSFCAELMPLSRGRTRISVEAEMKAQNLSARLLIQSLKLARGNLSKRFNVRVADFAQDIEDRCSRMA